MGLRINQNIAAMNAYRNLSVTSGAMDKSLEKLSSGFRINRAADDAAGLSISENLRAQVGGLKVASRNAQDGISVVQTAEGALNATHALLQRVRELAVQGANTGGTDQVARDALATEARQALAEIDRIGQSSQFGGLKLLDGSATALNFQVGSTAGLTNQVTVKIDDMRATALGVQGTGAVQTGANTAGALGSPATGATIALNNGSGTVTTKTFSVAADASIDTRTTAGRAAYQDKLQAALDGQFGTGVMRAVVKQGTAATDFQVSLESVSTTAGTVFTTSAVTGPLAAAGTSSTASGGSALSVADQIAAGNQSAMTTLDAAIAKVSLQRANLGAYQNRLEYTVNNLSVSIENLAASESRIRDTDMAEEMVAFTRSQILSQAGTAMLAQANQSPQGVLQLLRG